MGQVFRARDTVTDTLAAVLTRDIEWHRLPPATPPTLRRVLSRCLERDPKSRLRDIGDMKADLDPASTADPGQPKPQAGCSQFLPPDRLCQGSGESRPTSL